MTDVSQQLTTAIKSQVLANVQAILSAAHDDELYAITTPVIHNAIDDFDIFSLLLKRKFNLSIKNDLGETLLDIVLKREKAKHVNMLFDVMIKRDGLKAVYNELSCTKKYYERDGYEFNIAAQYGRLDLLIWCHENNKPVNSYAMDNAAFNGHLDTLRWLDEHRYEGCSTWAMDWAACNGHLDTLRWLHENREEGCTESAMEWAAQNGHLDIVKFLHECGKKCTKWTLIYAAKYGRLDVVKFLCNNTFWSIDNINLAIDDAKTKEIEAYLESVRPLTPLEKIEKEYFDEFATKLSDNFVNGFLTPLDFCDAIISKLVNAQDINTILMAIGLPRYEKVDATRHAQIIYLLTEKQDVISFEKLLDILPYEKIDISYIIHAAIKTDYYQLITICAKKYKKQMIDKLSSAPKEKLTKIFEYLLK